MALPSAAREHYRAQQRLVVSALALTRHEWAKMGTDFDASWAKVGPRLVLLTAAAQLGAARNGSSYVPATLDELGQSVQPEGAVNPRALAGGAQSLDGLTYGSLDDLLYGAVIRARTAKATNLRDRLAIGGKHLDLLVHTQVSDASKQAASVAMTVRPRVGYIRMVNPPCCQRCAPLAGKHSGPQAFPRHPRCDCVAIPTTVANPTEPLVPAITPDQVKDLTKDQRQAIADGADMNQVINAHRAGTRSHDRMTTSEGRTRHGLAGTRLAKGQQRLTPEGVYKVSATRDEALRRLRENGYIL